MYDNSQSQSNRQGADRYRQRRRPASALSGMARCVASLLGGALLFCLGSHVQASVFSNGNVLLDNGDGILYGDDPFTIANEGIPIDGNFIDPFLGMNNQVSFEGRPNPNFTANINFDIYVGQTSFGVLLISGESALRDQDLIIGDMGEVNGLTRRGTGVVRITGFGSLYNNDPNILPFGLTTSPSVNPRLTDSGFDLYVGRDGFGTLEISLGGRAEIQDAVVVGNSSGSVGTLLVDGFDSYLGSGGFQSGAIPSVDDPHSMLIGRLGSGLMSITNGGQVSALAPVTAGGSDTAFGAVVGGNPFDGVSRPRAGGQGTVNVDGFGSKWLVSGTLQIGGYHNARNTSNDADDMEGDDVVYGGDVGRGTLTVSNGGLVSIVPPSPDPVQTLNQLDLAIGRFGQVRLNGGTIELFGGLTGTPQDPTPVIDRVRVINDGLISGAGRISTGQFRNRALGEVRVGAGEKLIIDANGRFTLQNNEPSTMQEYPLSNYGVIEVLGTDTSRAEIDFQRSPGFPTDPPDVRPRPFLNLPTEFAAPNGRTEGLIHGQHSIMRFRSGLENRGVLALTGGDNVVTGDVLNLGETEPGTGDFGRISIGPNTNVTFEDDLFVAPGSVFQLGADANFQVLSGSSFNMHGHMQITVGGSSNLEFDPIAITGNAFFTGGTLEVALNRALIQAGDRIPILTAGALFGSPILAPGIPDLVAASIGNTLYLVSITVPPGGGTGADFNGDGIVDEIDFAIWQQNLGQSGGLMDCSVPGDANCDGDVNGQDYLIWQMQVGGMGMPVPPGAGSLAAGAVPEPASCGLLATGSLLALALRRRRSI